MSASKESARGAVPDARRAPREFLEHLYRVAVERALPLASMGAHLPAPPAKGRTLVLGAGKAGGSMAQALDALWPADAPLSGLVVTRYHHIPPRPAGLPERIELVEAAHPVPDEAGLKAAERILALTDGLTADDLVLCLISGGGSALLTLPAEGLTLADKQRINKQLLESGAHIGEMNCVRKHLSRIKGGRLAAACAPAKVVTLTISDVPGDDPAVIASGPTVPDATTCADALAILDRYRIEVPPAVRARLESGALETPQPGDGVFGGHATHLIATPQRLLEAAAAAARAARIEAHILSDDGARRPPGSLLHPRHGWGQLRRVGRIALLHSMIEHDPVDVVDDLGLVPELDRAPQPALGDRAGIRIVQADPPRRPVGSDPGHRWRVCATICRVAASSSVRSLTARASRPRRRPRPHRAHRVHAARSALTRARRSARLALASSRSASSAAVAANSASSPVTRRTVACASSRPAAERVRSLAAISCARRPAARDRSRTVVRIAPPAAWIRLPVTAIRRDRLGQQTRVGRIGHVRRHHRGVHPHPVGAQQLRLGGLGQQRLVQPVHRRRPAPRGQLHQRRRMRHRTHPTGSGRTAAR